MVMIHSLRPGRPPRLAGHGYFAGEAPATADPDDPDGRAKIANVPSRVRVSVYERQTMLCLATTLSDAAGLWKIAGLTPDAPFTVIGFDNAGTVNAAIQDWVKPEPYDPASLHPMAIVGTVGAGNLGQPVSAKLRAAYAVGDVTFTVTAGALPSGWSISSVGSSCLFSGTSTTVGTYAFELTGIDEDDNEASANYVVQVVEMFSYWRIVVTANNGNTSYGTIVELEFRAVAGGVDQAVGGTATATSFANSDNQPSYAFDGGLSSKWTSASRPTSVAPQALQYHFPTPVDVRQVAIIGCIPGQNDMAPRDFTIEHSNDGVSWVIAGTFAGETGWASLENRLFTL